MWLNSHSPLTAPVSISQVAEMAPRRLSRPAVRLNSELPFVGGFDQHFDCYLIRLDIPTSKSTGYPAWDRIDGDMAEWFCVLVFVCCFVFVSFSFLLLL